MVQWKCFSHLGTKRATVKQIKKTVETTLQIKNNFTDSAAKEG